MHTPVHLKLQIELTELRLRGAGVSRDGDGGAAVPLCVRPCKTVALLCWIQMPPLPVLAGSGWAGQLGNESAPTPPQTDVYMVYEPIKVTGARLFKSIIVSQSLYSCALETSGEAWCWGFHPQVPTTKNQEPTRVAPGFSFSSIALGENHICGVEAATGKTLCW